jgi:hypothetical protein
MGTNLRQGLGACLGFGDYLDLPGELEQAADALPKKGVVIGQHDPDQG